MSTTTRTGPSQRTWWIVGTIGVLVMSGIAVWFGIAATSGKVHWVNTGFDVISDEQVDIRFDLRRDPDRAVLCDLHALDGHHARVGTGQVTVPPAAESPSRHIEPLRTVARAVTGYVDTCSYVDGE
ncbi:DUF4307 domain-containing protein [Ornithinimicrobium murale]|uniref:DUF4307 domain-containing protein n=1 Tax=Ornithinimicrobium murale TaxID=1050153 RepID=UPI000E0D4FE6|nr:DUF4307 domain-containing protein [Ornithinimicrobium murale]